MTNTMIKRFNLIISLWLIVIGIALCVFAHELDIFGLYIAALVVAALLVSTNVFTIISGIIINSRMVMKKQEKLSNYR